MRVLAILPPSLMSPSRVRYRVDILARFFGVGSTIVPAAYSPTKNHFQNAFDDPILDLGERVWLGSPHTFQAVVIMLDAQLQGINPKILPSEMTWYSQTATGYLEVQHREFAPAEYPHAETHIFNRLAGHACMRFFPYGYHTRYVGMGPLNAFGFRIPHELDYYERREPRVRLICILGGSGAWSDLCHFDDCFTNLLEKKLNAYAKSENHSERYLVLNFGMQDYVVMHELLTYLMFIQRLRPDYVITHDGANDLGYSARTDTYLLNRHSLTYPLRFETWAQRLHETNHLPCSASETPYKIRNLPHNIIHAYLQRKYQLCRIVEADGAAFIWGFQPTPFAKRMLSPEEKGLHRPVWNSRHSESRRKRLYELYYQHIRLPSTMHVVDCFQHFKHFGEDVTLFGDQVHTLPAGDRIIADLYFDYFQSHFMNHWPDNRKRVGQTRRPPTQHSRQATNTLSPPDPVLATLTKEFNRNA